MSLRKCDLCGEIVKSIAGQPISEHDCPHGDPCGYRPYTFGIRCKYCHKRHPKRKEWDERNRLARTKGLTSTSSSGKDSDHAD